MKADVERSAEAVALMAPYEPSLVIEGSGLIALTGYGRALLASGQPDRAAEQLKRIVAHPGLDPSSAEHVIVRAWLARAYARAGKVAEARKEYEGFLELWKNADPDLPLLREVKAEYARLSTS